jgi:NAD(P)-dependent dehydrogenase (short-subunit alcohol dehydrogenase family)
MTSPTTPVCTQREPELLGQTVVVIGGSAGIGFETARRARAEGADVILTGRSPDRLKQAALELGAQRTAAFDANNAASLESFFQDLPTPIDHVMVTAGGPHYGPLLEMDSAQVRQAISEHVVLALEVARNAADKMRPGGTLLLMGDTGGRRVGHGLGSPPPPPPRCLRSPPPSRLSSRRFASTSSPPASSTPRCRQRCSEINSRSAAMNCGRRCRSAASSAPPTSPRSPSTS